MRRRRLLVPLLLVFALLLLVTLPYTSFADEAGETQESEICFDFEEPSLEPAEDDRVPVYRMYNRRTSEHLYTTNEAEYMLCGTGNYRDWRMEGIGWFAPRSSSAPVYRLYNPGLGDHHYTASLAEAQNLMRNHGWRYEGICWYSDTQHRVALHRVYNGRLRAGQHHYTTSTGERDSLIAHAGWRNEGIGWYGVAGGIPIVYSDDDGGGSGSGESNLYPDRVWIVNSSSSEVYHRGPDGCRSISRSSNKREVSLKDAQAMGRRPCRNCWH